MPHQLVSVCGRVGLNNGAGSAIDWRDIQIGKSLTFYGREFFVTGCDDATKDFLYRNGVKVEPNASLPTGPYEDAQQV